MKRALSFLLAFCLFASAFALLPAAGVADVEDPRVPVIVGTRIRINCDITIKFYLRVCEGTMDAGLYISEGGRTAVRVDGVPCREAGMDDGTYYVVSYKTVTVDEMTVSMLATPFGVVGTEFLRGKQSYDFTLQDYAMGLLRRTDLTSEERDLLLAMLNYGAAVQDFLNIRLYNKPNATLTDEERALPSFSGVGGSGGDFSLGIQEGSDADRFKVKCKGVTLRQSGYIQFWFYLQPGNGLADSEKVDDYRVEVVCDGITKLYDIKEQQDGMYYLAATDGIPFFDLRKEMVFRVVGEDGEAVSATGSCSLESYLEELRRQAEEKNELLSLKKEQLILRALAFGDAMNAYAEAKQS